MPGDPPAIRAPARTSAKRTPEPEPGLTEALLARLADLPENHPDRRRLREQIIELNLPLAHRLAHRFHHCAEHPDDLKQVAALALVKAVDRYDPSRGTLFRRYAIPTILGQLKRHLRDTSWTVRIPRPLQELGLLVTRTRDDLATTLGRTPTVSDLADVLRISERDVRAGLELISAYRYVSLDRPAASDGTGPHLLDQLGDLDPDLELAENRATLRALLTTLPERERRILTMRYFAGMTQASIAATFDISQMHVSRLLNRSLAQLRKKLLTETRATWTGHPGLPGPPPRAPG